MTWHRLYQSEIYQYTDFIMQIELPITILVSHSLVRRQLSIIRHLTKGSSIKGNEQSKQKRYRKLKWQEMFKKELEEPITSKNTMKFQIIKDR